MVDVSCDTNNLIETLDATCDTNKGESMDLGNTFWQADLGKTKKTYLDRGFIKPSTEVLIPRPRVSKYLDRGLKRTSVESFKKPRSRY